MTDREILLAIAKKMYDHKNPSFANFEFVNDELGVLLELGSHRGAITSYWNPLDSRVEAFHLMVLFKIDLKFYDDYVVGWFDGGFVGTGRIPYEGNPEAATRRAICIAAASQETTQ